MSSSAVFYLAISRTFAPIWRRKNQPFPPPPPKKKLLWLGLPDEIYPTDISLVTPQEYFVYKLGY